MHDLEFAQDLLADTRLGFDVDNLPSHDRAGRDVLDLGDCPAVAGAELVDDGDVLLSEIEHELDAQLEIRKLLIEPAVVGRGRGPMIAG